MCGNLEEVIYRLINENNKVVRLAVLPFGALLTILFIISQILLFGRIPMAEREYDVTVIGGGPGGYVAAIRAAQLGMKVGLIEREKLGGVCLNWGCIPSKALLKSAELYNTMKKSQEFGITHTGLSYDFPKIITRSRGVADRVSKGVEYLMRKNKIETVFGTAKLTEKNSIEITKDGKVTDTIKTKILFLLPAADRALFQE